MELRVVAVGEKPPSWVVDGVREYTRRMPSQLPVNVTTVRSGASRSGADAEQGKAEEGKRLIAASRDCRRIALDAGGRHWDTATLARWLDDWLIDGRDVAFLVGGADGIAADCLAEADQRWALSALTLPHMLVRVVVAEQLYRAWTMLNNHPYHRG
jgi:23S rRNA (pseudouridine1915-N3)-methyltransferase